MAANARVQLVLICGPNGIGKSTVCRAVFERLRHSALLESEWCRMTNPFEWNEQTIALATHNITHMLRGYLSCAWLDYVIFPYGFHGPRQQIWNAVLDNLQDIPYIFTPLALTCAEDENIARMARDGRDPARISRALAARDIYTGLPYPSIDTTHLTIEESVEQVLEFIQRVA